MATETIASVTSSSASAVAQDLAPSERVLARVRQTIGGGQGFDDWDLSEGSGGDLKALGDALGVVRREVDQMLSRVAHEVAQQSTKARGNGGLARVNGHPSPDSLIAAQTGVSRRDAQRFSRVGQVLADAERAPSPGTGGDAGGSDARDGAGGEPSGPRLLRVAKAVSEGSIGVAAADAIRAMVTRVHQRVPESAWKKAESVLVDRAVALPYDQLLKAIRSYEKWMKLDALEQEERERYAQRFLSLREDEHGMVRINGLLDPESAAPLVAAVDGMVAFVLRQRNEGKAIIPDERTMPQVRADALSMFAHHVLSCDHEQLPLASTRMIVTVPLAELESRVGAGTVDALGTPLSAGALRRLAAESEVIPAVLGGQSEVLDLGRTRRLFTSAQKAGLAVRDGGCAMCGAPISWTKAHHIKYWKRDNGPTDFDNGALLCTRCHRDTHDQGWEIVATKTTIAFRPPASVDPRRKLRPGGRRLFQPRPDDPPLGVVAAGGGARSPASDSQRASELQRGDGPPPPNASRPLRANADAVCRSVPASDVESVDSYAAQEVGWRNSLGGSIGSGRRDRSGPTVVRPRVVTPGRCVPREGSLVEHTLARLVPH